MPLAPPALITGAVRLPLPYGLFSTFSFAPSGGRWEAGVAFESGTCEPAGGIGAPDCVPEDTLGLPKDLDPNGSEPGVATPFTVYGHFTCSPVGYGGGAAQDKASEHLLAREEARVEQALWTGDLGNVPNFTGADVLGGGPVSVSQGLALLESYLGDEYGSLGVIHLTRGAAAAVAGHMLIESKGSRLVTMLGTPVAAGAGYPGSGPDGTEPGPDTTWAYVTPAIFGYRSDVFTSSTGPGDLFDRTTNTLFAIAERSYLLGFDPCGVGAVEMTLP